MKHVYLPGSARAWRMAWAALLVAGLVATAPLAGAAQPLRPNPQYGPGEVVRLVLEGLAHNDEPHDNAGIERAFRFASPANKSQTGPLERFVRMVHNPLYAPLIDYAHAAYGPLEVERDHAAQAVTLTTVEGKRAEYVFHLSRQHGGAHDGAWMTDSVIRRRVREDLQAT